MDRGARFWDRIAERYSRQPIADEAAYQKKLAKTREYLTPETKVLEIGCGTGSTAILHAPYVEHIRAVDFSSKMLEIARAKAAAKHVDNITWTRSAIEDLDVEDGSVDVVLGLSILHLLEDRDDTIRRVHAMLRPGGVFISSTVCLGDGMRFLELIAPLGRWLGLMPLLEFVKASELEASLTGAGFEIDYQWRPGDGKTLFVVAKKAE